MVGIAYEGVVRERPLLGLLWVWYSTCVGKAVGVRLLDYGITRIVSVLLLKAGQHECMT